MYLRTMNFILFDDHRESLLPLTFTRPVCEIRVGILTIREKWQKRLKASISHQTQDYLSEKFPIVTAQENVWINGSVCPDEVLVKEIKALKAGEAIVKDGKILAFHSGIQKEIYPPKLGKETGSSPVVIRDSWDIFRKNGEELERDYKFLTKGKRSQRISKTNKVIGKNIFLEKGAKAECAILNSSSGPIYIGKDAEVMEGSMVRGPFALGENSTLKLSAKIYGPTTIGPYCKVGGEVNNSVIFGYSNKAHDGFLGNSVLGEWCNIGADSNNSNLKNNYAEVKLWNYGQEKFVSTGLTFCGLIMGDHSKCGINTMFNTGTVVGVSANVFGAGFPRNFVADFSWGGSSGFTTYKLKEAFETAERMMSRRDIVLDETEKKILTRVFELTEKFRK